VLRSYLPVVVFAGLGVIVGGALAMVNGLVGPRRPSKVKSEPYECGLPTEVTRTFRFGVIFYMIAMLFILFDIEVVFLYPVGVILRAAHSVFVLVEIVVFVVLLFLLHPASALVPMVTLPFIVLLTFAALRLFGVPVTVMSLGGIAIALGLAVDADLVALEACHRRLEAPGGGGAGAAFDRRRRLIDAAPRARPCYPTAPRQSSRRSHAIGECGQRRLPPRGRSVSAAPQARTRVPRRSGPRSRNLLLSEGLDEAPTATGWPDDNG